MRISAVTLAPVLVLAVSVPLAPAQCVLHPVAPDAVGPGFYVFNPCEGCGCLRGPYYCLRPTSPCFNGLETCQQQEAYLQRLQQAAYAQAQAQAAMQQQYQAMGYPWPPYSGQGPSTGSGQSPNCAPGPGQAPNCAPGFGAPQDFRGIRPFPDVNPNMAGMRDFPWLPPNAQGQGGLGPQQPGTLAFPTHPYARSPRDFFMVGF